MKKTQLKPKSTYKCSVCREQFKRFSGTATVCSVKCALAKVEQKKLKEFKARTRRLKAEFKSRGDWLKEAQDIFNTYIRLRDRNQPCISCQSHDRKKWNAGHYKSVGSSPELRFNEFNVHKQCEQCNSYQSGNQVNYRIYLIQKIGIEMVEDLEGPHSPLKLTIDAIKDIKSVYKKKTKELKMTIGNQS